MDVSKQNHGGTNCKASRLETQCRMVITTTNSGETEMRYCNLKAPRVRLRMAPN